MGGHHLERKVKKKNKSAKVVKDTREKGAPSLKLKITLLDQIDLDWQRTIC